MKELCERIQNECRRKGRSLGYVMSKANLGSSIFYKWQKGQSQPRPQSIKAIAKALGMPAMELAPEFGDALNEDSDTDDALPDGDIVFVGMKTSVFNALRPFLERAKDGVVYVPKECSDGLLLLIKELNISQQLGLVGTCHVNETCGKQRFANRESYPHCERTEQ